MKAEKIKKQPVKYYYRTEINVCVLCGREKKYKGRVTDKKESGIHFSEDACETHFIEEM